MLHDVIIAGAGPVGLLLACELRLRGASVLILERADDPQSPLKRLPFGMRGLSAPSIQALDRRDLLDAVAARQPPRNTPAAAHWAGQARTPAGHFAGIPVFQDRVDTAYFPYHRPGPGGTSMMVDMQSLETVLAERAATLGVQIRRGAGVDAVHPAQDHVTVSAGGQTFSGRWLVGCDGGRSTVRKAAGFSFAGTAPEFTGYSVQVDLAGPVPLTPGRHYTATGMYTYAAPGTIGMVEFDGGAHHRQPLTRTHIEGVLQRVSCTDVQVAALQLATTWTDRAYQASTYRRGRVLLAGDAAHVHSPLGGQGLNLGLGDAMNLGWKLAATLQGNAAPGLLDTYTGERHPVGEQVLDWSRAQVTLMRPTPATRALEAILRDLIQTRDGATYVAGRVSGVGLRLALGDPHPLVGRSVPDVLLDDGTRVGERLRTGQGLLLDVGACAGLADLAEAWAGRVAYAAVRDPHTFGLRAVLVRPDGVVAWASDGAYAADAPARALASLWMPPP
ncbi:FAD-dependent monooxygenase [Bacillus subtilis subsp. subtilis]|nr:FAD-dependent monooxygenase [Bacillus subtilis subsp. subtilis]